MRKLLLTGIVLVAFVGVSSAQNTARKKSQPAKVTPAQEVKRPEPATASRTAQSKPMTEQEKAELAKKREALLREPVAETVPQEKSKAKKEN